MSSPDPLKVSLGRVLLQGRTNLNLTTLIAYFFRAGAWFILVQGIEAHSVPILGCRNILLPPLWVVFSKGLSRRNICRSHQGFRLCDADILSQNSL